MGETLYTAEATSRGDGRNGEVTSSDGTVDEKLSVPQGMGGPGGEGTNPEQLFAAGYSACFHGALRLAARQAGVDVGATEVTARVSIGKVDDGGFGLAVALESTVPGVDQAQADDLVHKAHELCPYSRATRGNIPVDLTAKTG